MKYTPAVAFMKDQAGRYVYINARFEQLFHTTLEELRGATDADWLPEEAAGELRRHDEAVLAAGTPMEVLEQVATPDGVIHHWAVCKFPFVDSEGQRFLGGVALDVTERQRTEQELRKSHRFIERIAHTSPNILYIYDVIEQRNTYANREVAAVMGYTPEEFKAMGTSLMTDLMHPEDLPKILAHFAHLRDLEDSEVRSVEYRMQHKDGTWKWIVSRDTLFSRLEDGSPKEILGTAQDITEQKWFEDQVRQQIQLVQDYSNELELKQGELQRANMLLAEANAKLGQLATTDGLTGLRNHRAFQEFLEEECKQTVRYGLPLSIILLDVDRFKLYNDTFGHPAGDEVLRQVAVLLKEHARESDYVARYGGEEFVIVLPNTDEAGSIVMAERFRERIATALWPERNITASFGVASQTSLNKQPAQLITEADKALYRSKAEGRNRVIHSSHMPPNS